MALSDSEDRPDAKIVTKFHTHADTNVSKEAIHHTLGTDVNQAASGAHRHDGKDSVSLLDGIEIIGNTDAIKINSIIAALERLGATDSTT